MVKKLNLRGPIALSDLDSESSQKRWQSCLCSLYLFVSCEDMKGFPFKQSSSKANHNPTHHSPWRNWMKRSQTEGEMGRDRQVPEKFIKVHRNIIGTSYFLRKATLPKVSSSWTLFYAAFFGEWHMLVDLDREILKMAKMTCGFISSHLISCQLCFLLPSSCALHARSKSPAVPRAAPWVDEGHLHANLMTTCSVNFFGLSLSVNNIL